MRYVLALSLALICVQARANDFRNVTWGMVKAQVLAAESNKPVNIREINGEVVVEYDLMQYGDLASRVIYIFAKDKLVRAKYLFEVEHTELNDFIADFKRIEPRLQAQYGKPSGERAIWENDATQLEPKSYLDQDRATASSILASDANVGLAVSLGHLRLFAQWDGVRTRVMHALSGENNRIVHQIEYRSVELEALENSARSAKP
jgi:hypothetical protein